MEEFFENTQQYVKHVHVARWQDEQFRTSWDTFPIEIFLKIKQRLTTSVRGIGASGALLLAESLSAMLLYE